MKTISPELKAHLEQDVTTIAMGWRMERTDGQVMRFTSSTREIEIDLDDGEGPQVYSPTEGYNRSAIQGDAGGNISNTNIIGVLDNQQIDEAELRRGLYDYAEIRLFTFNYMDPSQGPLRMLRGEFGEIIVSQQGYFSVELRDLTQILTRELGEAYSKDCRADLGDGRCRVNLAALTVAFEVLSVQEDRRIFRVTELTPAATYPTGWFTYGKVTFDGGDNAGRSMEVRAYTADNGVIIQQIIELFDDVPFDIQPGDTGTISPGCDKRYQTCIDKFANWKNFVGEPFVPGQDIFGQYPDAQ